MLMSRSGRVSVGMAGQRSVGGSGYVLTFSEEDERPGRLCLLKHVRQEKPDSPLPPPPPPPPPLEPKRLLSILADNKLFFFAG